MRRADLQLNNRKALLEATIAAIAARGHQSTRLSELADQVGLTTGAIYSIFGSKKALMIAAIQHLMADFQQSLASLLDDPSLDLAEVLRGYADAALGSAGGAQGYQVFAFELDMLGAALRDPQLRADIAAEVPRRLPTLITLCTDRRIDPVGTHTTTADQARRLAPAVDALVTGFAQHAVLEPDNVDRDYVLESTVALITLVR
ncbi:TetR family transcriptional regulator [Nocardia cyriacigeorgica]|uniref:TetR family transcriptional regulator n=1 Tax=Nocardia cyriacigeorgica TaxID=135487 RepID=A0A6P1D1N7_9NOCA|nr:TetR/AcrR family transcriptional regulator [Nocardia cyriacigeorgica]NEW38045.1 TetR family transcriptional regulator [Nocardia cyriacigeorgica]NEW42953.1 TetR family transcriptional regulator [Nocardia cyriacigeorgica]NEW48572.1 TetR family transcriptional regulator [Nocardia cyriacigeorgica]NEW56202.1 TetR family transcriptional regulator [Nocardia cyriacigeorgica]